MTPALADLVARLKTSGRIAPDDVLALRREIYGAPQVAGDDLEALLALDAAHGAGSPEWAAFLGDAFVDYVVHQEDPEDYVDDAKADWLMRVAAGELKLAGGVEALVRVIESADGCPPALSAFVLGKLKAAAVAAARLDEAGVALVKRCVFAGGGEGQVGVTREEADALFDIDRACGAAADASWPGVFAGAVDDHLTAVSPFHAESRDDAARDEAWLKSRSGLFDFFKAAAHKPDFHDALRDVWRPYAAERDEWRDADAQIDADETAAAVITDEEARWLVGRLGEAPLTAAGRALVARLQGEDPGNAALKPLFDAA